MLDTIHLTVLALSMQLVFAFCVAAAVWSIALGLVRWSNL